MGSQAVQYTRFVPDSQHHRYNSLPELLANVEDRTLALLGSPGSGKTTLLRRLQWERAWEELKAASGQTSFLVPLDAYSGHGGSNLLRWFQNNDQLSQHNLCLTSAIA